LSYNYFNKDPRRSAHWSISSFAAFLGGFCAGVVANPIDIVYNRQVADALYPNHLQRKYNSFYNGLSKVHAEGALFRGALASGFAYGMLNGGMSNVYDYLKEYLYWIFGPTNWLRPVLLLPTTFLGVCLYLPFDNIKVRFHTMTPLPNGEMPYSSFFDCVLKVWKYEASPYKLSSPIAMLSGGVPAFWKIFTSLYIGVNLSDAAFKFNYMEGDIWEPSTVYEGARQGYIPHEPNHIDRYEAKKYSPFKSQTRPEKNISLGPGTESYIKY
jgi:hypothetical protein